MPVDSQLAAVGHHGLAAVFSTPGPKMPAIENLATFGPAGVLFCLAPPPATALDTGLCQSTTFGPKMACQPNQLDSMINTTMDKLCEGNGMSRPDARPFSAEFVGDAAISRSIGMVQQMILNARFDRMPAIANVLITGASGGLGGALARRLAAPGRRLSLWGRDLPKLEAVANACRCDGAEVLLRSIDFSVSGGWRPRFSVCADCGTPFA
jgi:hypothetical protein